jgi:hypothetical protein
MIADRRLLIVYAVLTLLAALFLALPPIGVLFSLFTLGAAGYLPSLWLYVTAMMPGVLLRWIGLRWPLSATVCVAAVAALALLPAWIAEPQAKRIILDYTSGDLRKELPLHPLNVELVRPGKVYLRGDDDPIEHAACDEICQRLLLTRQVQKVSVVAYPWKGEPVIVTYSLAKMDRCPTAFAKDSNVLPSTTRANIAGICIVPSRGEALERSVSIRHETIQRTVVPALALVEVRDVERIDISERRAGREDHLFRNTQVTIAAADAPLMVFQYAGFLTTVNGNAVAKHRWTTNPLNLLSFMAHALGLSIVPDDAIRPDLPPGAAIRRQEGTLVVDQGMVRSILGKPGADRFSPDLQAAVNTWTDQYWTERAAPDDNAKSLFADIILDSRMSRAGGVSAALLRNPDLVPQLADAILTRLAWAVDVNEFQQDRQFAKLFADQDDRVLMRNSEKLLGALRTRLSRNTSPLLVPAARLGRDGLPYLLAGMSSDDYQILADAAEAACRARSDIAADLSVVVQTLLSKGSPAPGSLIIALAALQGRPAAEAAIDRLSAYRQKQLRPILDNAVANDGAVRCPAAAE